MRQKSKHFQSAEWKKYPCQILRSLTQKLQGHASEAMLTSVVVVFGKVAMIRRLKKERARDYRIKHFTDNRGRVLLF